MKTIYLISCVSKKLARRARACELYQSSWFRKALAYAKKKKPDEIFILSAKYGLLPLEKEINPYNKTLNEMSAEENRKWAENVLADLSKVADLEKDKFVFLAGNNYRKNLVPKIKNYTIPMEGLRIGEQLKWLEEKYEIKMLSASQMF